MTDRMSVKQAQEARCCRICKGPDRPTDELGSFVLDYGHEYAHALCRVTETAESRIAWIEDNRETVKSWSLADFRDFYERDLNTLLPLAKAYLAYQAARESAQPDLTMTEIEQLCERATELQGDSIYVQYIPGENSEWIVSGCDVGFRGNLMPAEMIARLNELATTKQDKRIVHDDR